MDPLAATIALLRPRAVESKIIVGAGRWGVRYAAHGIPGFGLVLDGACWLNVEGAGVAELRAGDFVFLPATPGFVMSSHPGGKPTPAPRVQNGQLRHGPKDAPTNLRMLGGHFVFDAVNAPLLVRLLPAMMHVRGGNLRLRRLVRLIRGEASMHRPGRELILERLVEVMLVEALRTRPVEDAGAGLLAGLADPSVAAVLRNMHADVARPWTVAELARSGGMSRAVFAERFMRKVGVPPMEYLLQWRMSVARDLLRRQSLPLTEVAEAVGYGSASAFSTAFTRHVGRPPSLFARAG